MSRIRITVAGAGAMGLTAALALAEAGCEVAVFDPAPPLANASGVAAGMLAPAFEAALDPTRDQAFDLLLAGRDLWPGLEARLGLSLDRAGAIAVGAPQFLSTTDTALRRLGLYPNAIGRNTLAQLSPGLSPEWREGLLVREDWRLDPAQALSALRRAAADLGVSFHARAATGFEGADRLVVATGAATDLAVMAPSLSLLQPIKGQLVRINDPLARGAVVRTEGVYAAPSATGLVLGATMEPGRADLDIDPAAIETLRARGAKLFPRLADARDVQAQAGVRAASPDGLPLVGRGRHHGVLLAVGARRNGWLLAPLAARIIAACVTGRDAGPYAARLDPGRFAA